MSICDAESIIIFQIGGGGFLNLEPLKFSLKILNSSS